MKKRSEQLQQMATEITAIIYHDERICTLWLQSRAVGRMSLGEFVLSSLWKTMCLQGQATLGETG